MRATNKVVPRIPTLDTRCHRVKDTVIALRCCPINTSSYQQNHSSYKVISLPSHAARVLIAARQPFRKPVWCATKDSQISKMIRPCFRYDSFKIRTIEDELLLGRLAIINVLFSRSCISGEIDVDISFANGKFCSSLTGEKNILHKASISSALTRSSEQYVQFQEAHICQW